MRNLLIYSFQNKGKNNISATIISNLKSDYKFIIHESAGISTQVQFKTLLTLINKNKPQFIIGIGQYSGRDQDKIRIEIQAKNRFRNKKINKSRVERYKLYDQIEYDHNIFKKGTAMGNSWCNLSSYLVSQFIASKQLKSKLIFLHVPKNFDTREAIKSIEVLINNATKSG